MMWLLFFTRKENPASPTEYGASFAGAIDEELAPEILIRLWACGGKLWDNYHRPTFHTKENRMAFESILHTLDYIPEKDMNRSITQTVDDFCTGRTAMLITYSEFAHGINRRVKENVSGRSRFRYGSGKDTCQCRLESGTEFLFPHTEKLSANFFPGCATVIRICI